jgi:hypothetical protein
MILKHLDRTQWENITNRPTWPFYTPFRFATRHIKRPVNSNVRAI